MKALRLMIAIFSIAILTACATTPRTTASTDGETEEKTVKNNNYQGKFPASTYDRF